VRFDPISWGITGAAALAALASAAIVPPPQAIPAAILAAALVALAVIDSLTLRLPDILTLPLILAGLVCAWATGQGLPARLIGAALAFAGLALLASAYRRLRGRDGLGLGDAKLAAAGGAWVGWEGLPSILLVAAGLGLGVAAWRLVRRGGAALEAPLPFGPPLAAAIWLTWLLAAQGQGG
jgi:leader peptidase (prepilin peptidase)/N-methyltransferase